MRALTALLGLGFALALAAPAHAALSEDDLSGVALRPAADALIPADIPFADEDGRHLALGDVMSERATLLILADYNCRTICGPILATAEAAIRGSGLVVGRDFNLVVIGIDPTESRADAVAMKTAQFGDDPVSRRLIFLTATRPRSKGFRRRSATMRAMTRMRVNTRTRPTFLC